MIPLIPIALSLAPTLARWLGGNDAGSVAAQVAEAARAVVGSDDPGQVAAAIEADPTKRADLAIELARIAAEREDREHQARIEELRIAAADTAGARNRDVQLRQAGERRILPGWVLGLGTLGAGGAGAALVFGGLEEGKAAQAAIIQAMTVCLGILVLAAQFEWGSSRGSRMKDAASAAAPTEPAGPSIPPTMQSGLDAVGRLFGARQ